MFLSAAALKWGAAASRVGAKYFARNFCASRIVDMRGTISNPASPADEFIRPPPWSVSDHLKHCTRICDKFFRGSPKSVKDQVRERQTIKTKPHTAAASTAP